MNELQVKKLENSVKILPHISSDRERITKWQNYVISFIELAIKKDDWALWVFALQNAARYYNFIDERAIAIKLAQEILSYFPGESPHRKRVEVELQLYA